MYVDAKSSYIAISLYLITAYQNKNSNCNNLLNNFNPLLPPIEPFLISCILRTMKIYLALLTIFILLPGCSSCTKVVQKTLNLKQRVIPPASVTVQKQPTITVWVHGTQPPNNSLKALRNIVQKPLSLINRELMLPYVHSEPGLTTALSLPKNHYMRGILEILCSSDPINYDLNHCYVFGWSGKLNVKAREIASEQLYNLLCVQVYEYREKHGVTPTIRIITHSHGGNVALKLPLFAQDNPDRFTVNELILLACPVQHETAPYIANPMFKKIYSFYSYTDLIQIIDPQRLHNFNKKNIPLFSERRFPEHKKLMQVQLTFNNGYLFHISFIFDRFIRCLPLIQQEVDNWFLNDPFQQDQERKLEILI